MMGPACHEVLERLGAPLPDGLMEHVAACEHCQAVLAGFDDVSSAPAPEPSAEGLERMRQAASLELAAKPVATRWWKWAALLMGLNGVTAAIAVVAMGKHGLVQNHSSTGVVVLVTALLAAVMTAAAGVAVSPLRGSALRTILAASAGAALAVVLSGSGFDPGRAFFAGGVACGVAELCLALPPLLLGLYLLTQSAYRPLRALALGAACALVGMTTLQLHCPNGTWSHLLAFHVVPGFAVAGAALVVRRGMNSRSFAP